MTNNHWLNNHWIVIPAAGIGERFAGKLPKQYIKINDKTILQHSIERFIDKPWVKKIIVPIAKSDSFFATLSFINHPKIVCILGGEMRMHSVMNALMYLEGVAQNQDWVLVHDAVRSCLHDEDVDNLLYTLKDDCVGGLLCSKVIDTIKFCQHHKILHTVDRAPLWQALTPQMFRFEILNNAFKHCLANGMTITDESSAIEQLGLTPTVVEIKHPNPKLTFANDLAIFSSLLNKINHKMNQAEEVV